MPTPEIVERFMRLYRGRTDAYGTGEGRWVHAEPTAAVYDEHLRGDGPGLGIAPLLDDGTCWWAAIDLDEPDFDAAHEMQEFLAFGTTWIERSRSGNAHVLAFFSEPIEAWLVRGILREATIAIGKPAAEVFPKQDKLLEGMVGNYLNLAYHGSERPMLHNAEEPISLNAFTRAALDDLNAPDVWRKRGRWLMIVPPEQREHDHQEFGTGKELHMCAEWIIGNREENPVSEGHRNTVYFNLAKMLSHYEGFDHEEAFDMLRLVRDAADEQGVEHSSDGELLRILHNAERGGYTSTGCDDALMLPYTHPNCPIAAKARG
jgi:hypothetical protein